ncbi:MAG TPA: FtsX-like permease family protein, partial [Bacteroidales bacterium]|nr:FtsX-like permease family protein [Bacteroidales bacterium]
VSAVEDSMQRVWSLKDMGLYIKKRQGSTYDLISDRIFIDTVVQHVANRLDLRYEEIVTYLVNDIGTNGNHTPYSFASAVSPSLSGNDLSENEIILNQWTADDLGARAGDSVVLAYYEIGPMRKLYETSQKFLVKEIIGNTARVDSTLMPKFPGLSEAGNCSDWDAGVPIDLKKIRNKDEIYWDDYRGTPKVLLSLEKGKQIWENHFGSATTMRFQESLTPKDSLTSILLTHIKPSDLGFQLVDVRGAGMSAAENAVNFTELFLGMSFFVIAAGLLLTVLLYSLHFDRRSPETALLSGLGLSNKKILILRISESSLVILAGSIAGALLGILYNYALIAGINTIWHDMVRMDMLKVHITCSTLLTGAVISMVFAIIPVYIFTIRKLSKPVTSVIKGPISRNRLITGKRPTGYLPAMILLALSLIPVIISLVSGSTDHPLLYLISGAMFLLCGLAFVKELTGGNSFRRATMVPTLRILAISNLKRNPGRSLAVIALLAVGTFTVILTGAYRKTYHGTEEIRKSGTGGYLLWAETISPVLFDLNSSVGKERLIQDDSKSLQGVRFLQFEKIDGDDASCLNLNQAQQPEILSVNPVEFDSTGAFSFIKLPAASTAQPWMELDRYINDSIFPAFADQTVLTYSLKKKIGDTLFYINEAGKKIGLVITGSINNSIFQGNILISEKVFRKQFPSAGGSRIILADGPADKLEGISSVLSASLADYGIDVVPASSRLAIFNSVENTYLSVFMALSGLGLIIGTIGLGIILLRNVYERR